MTCTVRNFDRYVFTPIFWSFNIAAVVYLIGFHWWWLAGAIVGTFYTGIIGAENSSTTDVFRARQKAQLQEQQRQGGDWFVGVGASSLN